MKHLVLTACFIGTLATACQASDTVSARVATPSAAQIAQEKQTLRDEIYERARKNNGGKEPSKLELFNELMGKAQEHAGAVKDWGKPRVVARGPKPEIVIKGDQIFIGGTQLKVGESLARWKAVIGGGARCEGSDSISCIWDQIGIEIGTYKNSPNLVSGMQITLNIEPPDPLFPRPRPEYLPKYPFTGYLELDGYGIDAQTKFWEIRISADPKRNLRCNYRDCSHPHGRFSDAANLYLRLNSKREDGNVYEFTISGTEAAETEPK